jgi:hypothetical protein
LLLPLIIHDEEEEEKEKETSEGNELKKEDDLKKVETNSEAHSIDA